MAQREQFFQKASELLSGSYELISEIGYGGMGLVYKAREISSENIVAIKAIRPEHTYNDTMLKRFEKEVLLTQKVDSRHVVNIKNYLVVEGFHFIVMEYLKGESLAQIIRNTGSLEVKETVAIALQILEGLKAAHDQSVIHRDLKPHNIVVDSQGAAVITDFGLAREVDSTRLTATSGLMGTPQYIAPEQWLGEKPDLRTDIYSFGIMLYEMVYGLLPFQSSKDYGYMDLHLNKPVKLPGKVDGRKIPGYLRGIILKCLEKKPSQRYQSVQQIIDDLSKQRATGSFKIRIKSRLKRTSKALVVSVLLLMALIAGAYFTESYIEEKTKPVPAKPTKPLTFAVLYFEDKTDDPELEFLSYGIPDMLTTDLLQSKFLYILNQLNVHNCIGGLRTKERYHYSKKDLRRFAEISGINYLITGKIEKEDRSIKVTLKISDGESGGDLFFIEEKCDKINGIYNLVDNLTRKIKRVGIDPAKLKSDNDRNIVDLESTKISAVRHFVIGRKLKFVGNLKKSLWNLKKATEIDPGYARAYYAKYNAFLGVRKFNEARDCVRKALAHSERLSVIERDFIKAQYAGKVKRDFLTSRKMLEQIVRKYPNNLEAQIVLARLLHNSGYITESEELFLKIKKYTKNPQIMLFLMIIKTGTGDLKGFKDLLTEARIMAPRSLWRYELEYDYRIIQKQYYEAVNFIKRCSSSESIWAIEKLIQVYILTNEFDKASEYLDKMHKKIDSYNYYIMKLGFLLSRGHYFEAKELVESYLKSGKDDYGTFILLFQLACLEAKADSIDSNLRYTDKLNLFRAEKWRGHSQEWVAIFNYGYMNSFSEDNRGELKKYIHRLQSLFKDNGVKLVEDGASFLECIYKDDHKALERLYSDYIKINSGYIFHALCLDRLLHMYLRKDMNDKALYTCERIQGLTLGRVLYGDVYALSFYHQGKIYQKLKEYQKARKSYTQFLKLWGKGDRHIFKQIDDAEAQLKKISSH